jgi:antitoxin PrlF
MAGKKGINTRTFQGLPAGLYSNTAASYCNAMPDEIMAKITMKGQVTLPKKVRDAVGLRPGDQVEVRVTASGGVYIGKPGVSRAYGERLDALAQRQPVRNITSDELMEASRGEIPSQTEKRRRPRRK